jgi:hypothetical protein
MKFTRHAVLALLSIVSVLPQPVFGAPTEIDLRDFTYVFDSPNSTVGPWHVAKLDAVHTFGDDTAALRLVEGARDDAGAPAHGTFVRLEDVHRFTSAFQVKAAAGVGNGYQPFRTTTLEAAARPDVRASVDLAAGIVLTSITNAAFQRIVAFGPDVRSGNISGYLRYYRPSSIGLAPIVPPSLSSVVNVKVARPLSLGTIVNFGGEIGGDRTQSELPTSSGRYGLDVAGTLRMATGATSGITALYEVADYRRAPSGAFARRQNVIALGAYAVAGR